MAEQSVHNMWQTIEEKLKNNPAPHQNMQGVYEVQLKDETDGVYQLEFDHGEITVYTTKEKEPLCILKMKTAHFNAFLKGELNSTTAFMTGKLKIDGQIGQALKLDQLLKQYDFSDI
ncbi:Propanoyl-CoA C-acyltransferase [Lentibacillus sp. JNUCC-1]|uniref:SCP2 sterol-binding domain-containing protein n=1 Tax=Lentibacillus sp. JNUCC-1 TaxID=2654513 RepID=UPI0012E837C1|nr:SCP2 sterol-binding domain-containing protein [Lentibacillus sp. JNUCC-1]MUV38016.1 Propanoyl-CoA C-acyltransferase [Lentibacillus sp. JNUCC-1]